MSENTYAFAATTKASPDLYVEDRGYPCRVERGTEAFSIVDAELGEILSPGQTAMRMEDGSWSVQDGFPMLEDIRARRLSGLHEAWLEAEASGTVEMEGVAYDCTSRANRDIAGLIVSMEASGTAKVLFCAADNSFHELSLADLKSLQLLVIGHAQALYSRKWELRAALESAQTLEAVQAVQISFEDL